MNLKIAILVNTAWNAWNFRRGLIRHLQVEGHELVVIAPRDEYVPKLEQMGVCFHPIELQSTGTNPLSDWKYRGALKQILRNNKVDMVLSFTIKPNIYGALACRSLGIPIICNVSGLGTTFQWKGWVRRAAVLLYTRAFRRADFIFFQNKDDREMFFAHVKVDASKSGLLPGSGINLEDFRPKVIEPHEGVHFLMIARLIVEKGIREFVEAAKLVRKNYPNARFTLIGAYDPAHSRSISAEEFEELKAEVTYLTHQDNVPEHIEEADVVVLPSYREGTPRTLLEAGAIGRPLLATDVPGCREVVVDGVNGFLCEVENARSLARKMELFISLSDDEKRAMGAASRRWIAERFDERIVITEYLRKINQLVS